MNEEKNNVLVMANFKAECSGNFINSLLALADKGKNLYNFYFLFPLLDNGTEASWVSYIRKHGYETKMFDSFASDEENTKLLFDLIEKYKIDMIHNHFSCLGNICLWNKELRNKVKILYHDHMDYTPGIPMLPQIKKHIKTAKRYREYGIGVISVMKRKHRGYFLTPKKWWIPNGVSFKRNVDHSMSREECRVFLNLKEDEKLCLFLGWDVYRKGLDVAIKAIQIVRKQGYGITLGLVGFGENISDEQIKKIKEKIGFDPRQDGVRFLDAWEDMFALHRASDVFLSASRNEAFSYAILEAISQNVPVVTSNISGARWSLKYSKAFKFPSGNYEKCAEQVIQALKYRDYPSNYKEMMEKYNIDLWAQRVLTVYAKMLNH